MKKSLIMIVGIWLWGVVGAKAAEVNLSFDPGTRNGWQINEEIAVKVKASTGTNRVSTFILRFNYDAAKLEIAESGLAMAGGFAEIQREVRNGKIYLSGQVTVVDDQQPYGEIELATIRIKAKANGQATMGMELGNVGGGNLGQRSRDYTVAFAAPSYTIGSGSTTDGVLRFKVAFAGVGAGAGCVGEAKATVTVMDATGFSQTYNDVPLTESGHEMITMKGTDTAVDLKLFSGQVTLTGMGQRQGNLAMFIKGSKTMQIKYARNGQNDFYNRAGGELAAGATEYNFSGYPILAGDVRTASGDGQDGVVDGLDFSFVKQQAILQVARGGSMRADLNSDCVPNSIDAALLMHSLRERQEQLY